MLELTVVVLGISLATLLAWALIFSGRSMRKQKIERLGERTLLSADDFYNQYYASSGLPKQVVIELLYELGKALELPAGLLRPHDRFAVELASAKGWWVMDDRLDLYELMMRLETKHKVKVDPHTVKSVDELIRTVGSPSHV